MPPKVRVVKNSIGTEDINQFVKTFLYTVSRGGLDTHLDVLYEIVVDRITSYQNDNGDPEDPAVLRKLSEIRRLRAPSADLMPGSIYQVTGELYRGVTVKYLGNSSKSTPERPMARVEVVSVGQSSKSDLQPGVVKLIPLAALQDLPDLPGEKTLIEKI